MKKESNFDKSLQEIYNQRKAETKRILCSFLNYDDLLKKVNPIL